MKRLIQIRVNGAEYEFAVEPNTTLLEAVREHMGLTGTKDSCGTGECGACTVLLNGLPVLACLTLALDCQEMEVVTIEGLAKGDELHPVQQAFQDLGAIQCGFCTPGLILSTVALLKTDPDPGDEEIYKALEGNLCRCTGYNKIIEAVREAARGAASEEQTGSPGKPFE